MAQIKITATGPLEETTKFFDADDLNGQMRYLAGIKRRHQEFLDRRLPSSVSKESIKKMSGTGAIWKLRAHNKDDVKLTVNIEHVD